MFKSKKMIFVLIAVMLVSVALSGCGNKSAEEVADKDNLIVAMSADAKSLDPHATNDSTSSNVMKQIYNTLIDANEEMELKPGLAESWNQADEKTLELTLRQGVKFHNGEELKASDVKFTLDRMLASSKVAHIVEAVESVEVVDDYKVVIKTKEAFGPLLNHLAHPAASILNEKAVTEAGDNYGQSPVGTGPFKFVAWEPSSNVQLTRFDDYYEGAAAIKDVTFRVVKEGTNRTIGLETQEVDIAYGIEAIDRDRISEDPNLELLEKPAFTFYYVGFDVTDKPFDNKLVRQAMNYAVDQQPIIDAILDGAGEKATAPIAPAVFGANTELEGYDYNPEKAKELLAEAGYPDGFETKIMVSGSSASEIAQIVQAQLKEVGIDMAIESIEWGTFIDATAKGDHEMFFLGWGTVTADADYGLYPMFHSSAQGSAGNRFFYANDRVDELLETGKNQIDQDTRAASYKEAQEIIVDEAPYIPMYYKTESVGTQGFVKGFKINPAGHHDLYNVYFEQGE